MSVKRAHARKWIAFPHDSSAFQYDDKELAAHWSRLHIGDCEPFPSRESVAQRIKTDATAKDAAELAGALRQAWRAFHAGEFQRAHELAQEIGPRGFVVEIKSIGIYAGYLETSAVRAEELLLAASQRAEQMIEKFPREPNAHYLHALALGRHSQRISVLQALAQGLAPKIEGSLQKALELEPKHADAHVALGLYHAEIVGKLGSLAAGLTYGASKRQALDHFKKAIKLNPTAPGCKVEYARGLKLLDGDESIEEAIGLLEQAAHCKPMDATEALDRERAKALLARA